MDASSSQTEAPWVAPSTEPGSATGAVGVVKVVEIAGEFADRCKLMSVQKNSEFWIGRSSKW